MDEILAKSALELGQALRDGEYSSEELTRFFLERIERLEGELNSFVTVLPGSALRAARAMDRKRARRSTGELPIFHGVPCAIKDLTMMRGTPTKLGSRSFRWFVAPVDAPAAKHVRRAGFVVLGKASTSEFGALPYTEPEIHPPTRNPWNPEHTSGGSSGGSASAVAAGQVPIALGSDGGGSIRIPAAFTHLFGFKPSLSLVGNQHGAVNRLGLSVNGPLTHTVEDAAALLDVLRGHADGHLARGGGGHCMAQRHRAPRGLRIRMITDSTFGPVEPEIVQAVERTGSLLTDFGHHVETVPMMHAELEEFLPLWKLQMAGIPSPAGEAPLQDSTRWLRAEGRGLELDAVLRQRDALNARVEEFMQDVDLLLSPTVPVFAPRVGQYAGLAPEALFEAIAPIASYTAVFNITRGPAVSIPAGVSATGLPYAVQLAAHPGQDGTLLALSHQLEEAMPWRERRPPCY